MAKFRPPPPPPPTVTPGRFFFKIESLHPWVKGKTPVETEVDCEIVFELGW